MEHNELKKLLDGLDMAHAEMVHSFLRFDLMNAGLAMLIGREKVEPYWRLCNELFKEKDASVLPALNEVCCGMVKMIEEEREQGNLSERYALESLATIKRLAERPVRNFTTSLKEEMPDAWQEAVQTDEMDVAFMALAPLVMKMAEQVQEKHHEEAAGNLLGLFGCMVRIKERHKEWFEVMLQGGDVSDMVYLLDAAVTVYCHLRQKEDLPKDLGEDMDTHLLLLNEQTGLFGEWTQSIYADMLYTAEYQSEDYSDLENCEMWNGFQEEMMEMEGVA